MDNLFKKVVSGFVSMTTILSTVGVGTFALPSAASAASLMSGDLIKASGPAVYYYGNDQKRYVFPNEKTYFSWFSDFSSVKTITDAELAAIMIGGNVTIRPGTKLVKITTDPKVYAVTRCGTLHWVESEAVASALFGGAWASKVVDVPDGFFVNYTVGSSVSTAVHPDGSLINYASNPATRYVVWGGAKRMLSDMAFAANGFNALNVMTTTVNYPDGSAVAGREGDLADAVCAGGAPVSGGLTVTLASDTPAGATVTRNASAVQMAKFNLQAGGSAVSVTGLKLKRVGVGSSSDLTNVYLYDMAGNRLTTGRTVNSVTNLVEFNSLTISVPANGNFSVVVVADVSVASGSTGGQHSFEISDAASTVVSGNVTISGSYPVRGNVFTIGTASASQLTVTKGTQPSNPNIGSTEAEISNFKLQAGNNDIEVRRVTLYQAGSITNSDLTDLKLYQGTTLVATASGVMNNQIVLNFNPAYLLPNGTTKTFSLKARVGGRATRTIKTYVEYTTDVYAMDKVYNSGAAVCIASTATGGCASASQGSFDGSSTNFIEVTTQGGALTVTFNGPPTSNVMKGGQDIALAKFSLASPDNTLELRNTRFKLEGITVNSAQSRIKGTGGTDYFRDLKVKNLDTGATMAGPINLGSVASTAAAGNFSQQLTINNSYNINAGEILNLAITADIANAADSGDDFLAGTSTYRVVLGDSTATAGEQIFGSTDVRVVSTGEFLAASKVVPNTAINGNSQTVKQATLAVSLASNPTSMTIVKKQQNVDSVGLVLTTGQQSDVLVTALKLTGAGNTTGVYSLANLDEVVTQCGLFDGATPVGVAQTPDTTGGFMNITNMNLNIAKGTSKTLTVKCTADSVVLQAAGDMFAIGIAAAADITAQDQDSNTLAASAVSLGATVVTNAGTTPTAVVMTVKNGATLTVAAGSHPQSTIGVGNTGAWVKMAEFNASARYENVTLERIAVTSTGDAAVFSAIAVAQGGSIRGQETLSAGSHQVKDISLTTPITVPRDGAVAFELWAKFASVQSSSTASGATAGFARTGSQVKLGIAQGITSGEYDSTYLDKFNIKTVGAASGDRVLATSTNMTGGAVGNTFVLRKSRPTVVYQASSGKFGGTTDLFKFQVTPDAAGSVGVKKVTFQLSKSTSSGSALSINNFRMLKNSQPMDLADVRIVRGDGSDLEAGTWPVASSTGYVVVEFTNPEIISGSGSTYTLRSNATGWVSGDSVSVKLLTNPSSTITSRGYYTDYGASTTTVSSITLAGPHICTATAAPCSTASVAGTFVWSDLSENGQAQQGNQDWTDDVLLTDLANSQVTTP